MKEKYVSYYEGKKGETEAYKYSYKGYRLDKIYMNNKLSDKYTYNSKGNVSKIQSYEKGKLKSVTTYTYKNNKLSKRVTKEGKKKTNEATYYMNGSIKTDIWWDLDGGRTEYKYTSDGAYKGKEYDSENKLMREFSFDKKGNGTSESYRYEDGKRVLEFSSVTKKTYKNGVCAKEECTYTSWYYGTSYSSKSIYEYYTSGYRKECQKLYKNVDAEGNIVSGRIYNYKPDSTGKNVAVRTSCDIVSNEPLDEMISTYKKITITE